MKKISFSIALLMFIKVSLSQVNWNKYPSNPVITKGPDNFDIIAIGQPTVLFENDCIRMWYIGVGNDMKGRICYAFSVEGVQWIKHDSAVINVGNPGEWDCGWLDTPEIVKDASGYKMYYYGDTVQQFAATNSSIGMAFSVDGIHWNKHPGNPIFAKGNPGEWDCSWVESPAVIYNDSFNEYLMWYNGVDTSTWKIPIGLATSPDGINWTKNVMNPVVPTSFWGEYDDLWLGTPAVLFENGEYKMWYSSAATRSYNPITERFDTMGICYATSVDGINWIKHISNPLFNTYTLPYDSLTESGGPWGCDVVYDSADNNYKMWYETSAGFCFATADITTSTQTESNSLNIDYKVYPNPANDILKIESSYGMFSPQCRIILYDVSGNMIVNANPCLTSVISLDIQNLIPGTYVLEICGYEKCSCRKLEIVH